MRFIKPFWEGIGNGTITVAFRRWRKPTVVAGRPYRTGGGRIEVLSVAQIDPAKITKADAKRSGQGSVDEIREQLRGDDTWPVWRVEFKALNEPDPREVLANTSDLSDEDLADINKRLDRLDKASSFGTWTRSTLQMVADNPEVRAPDLAESVGRETKPFKLDVRKLKNLGLTISLRRGYRISPRGQAYLDSL